MKKMILTLLSTSFLFSYTLTIEITGIENNRGQLLVGLYNQQEGFREIDMTFKKGVVTTLYNKSVIYNFEDIPKGSYSISIFHDENSNNQLDSNFLGIPKEGYGFSNNIRHALRATSFDEAKFELISDMNMTIQIEY